MDSTTSLAPATTVVAPPKASIIDRSDEGCDRIQRTSSESDLVHLIPLYFDEPRVIQHALCKMIRQRSVVSHYAVPSYENLSEASREAARSACLVLPSSSIVTGLALLLGHPAGASTLLKSDLVYTVITAVDQYPEDPWVQMNGFRWLTHLYHLTAHRFLMVDAVPLAMRCLQVHSFLEHVLIAAVDFLSVTQGYAQCHFLLTTVARNFPDTLLAGQCQDLIRRVKNESGGASCVKKSDGHNHQERDAKRTRTV